MGKIQTPQHANRQNGIPFTKSKKTNYKVMKPIVLLTPIIAFTATTGTLSADHHETADKPSEAAEADAKDIVTIASEGEDFATLVAAIKAAGLAEKLSGEGPFTVFAPTNAAFGALPEGTVVKLMEPGQKDKLTEILMYHVVPGKIMAGDIAPMNVTTAGGKEATFTVDGQTVMINGVKVIKSDVVASNGVIHVIDKVLMPPVEEEKE